MTQRDNIYKSQIETGKPFRFDKKVASVFDDMIRRSVPLYEEAQKATGAIAKRFAKSNSNVYDLGCATGTTLLELTHSIEDPTVTFIGVDNSPEMLDRARGKLEAFQVLNRVNLECANLLEITFDNPSLIILNYTLQFIPPESRQEFLTNVRKQLLPGGALLLSEKLSFKSTKAQEHFSELYYDFKRRNGYSELEIAKKREALENVLIPLTLDENIDMLKHAGFSSADPFLLAYNFVSIVALA